MLGINTETGELVTDDYDGRPVVLDQGALLRWQDIDYLEFTSTKGGTA